LQKKTKAAIRVLVVIMVEEAAAIMVEEAAAIMVEEAAAIMVEAEEQQLQRKVAAAIAMEEVVVVIPVILHLPRLQQTKKPVLMDQSLMLMVIVRHKLQTI
jgi:hypothetical protein